MARRTLLGMKAFLGAVAAAIAIAGLCVITAPPATAEDTRPCVSKREFYGSADFELPATHDPTSRIPFEPATKLLGRIKMESRWEVRHRGKTVKAFYGSDSPWMRFNDRPNERVKMYRACEAPLADMQIYVGYNKESNLVLWIMRWPTCDGCDVH